MGPFIPQALLPYSFSLPFSPLLFLHFKLAILSYSLPRCFPLTLSPLVRFELFCEVGTPPLCCGVPGPSLGNGLSISYITLYKHSKLFLIFYPGRLGQLIRTILRRLFATRSRRDERDSSAPTLS